MNWRPLTSKWTILNPAKEVNEVRNSHSVLRATR
jgi:hypothetical protein